MSSLMCVCVCACMCSLQHLAAGGRLDLTLLHGLVGLSWGQEQNKERYIALADKEDAAYQVGAKGSHGTEQLRQQGEWGTHLLCCAASMVTSSVRAARRRA